MGYKSKLFQGQVVELAVSEGEYQGRYRTRIEEVGEKILSVGAPYEHGKVVPLREGTKMTITFWDKIAAYSFEAEIIQRTAVPFPVFVLEFFDSIQKVQRRNFVRVSVVYPITFQMVNQEGLSKIYEGTMLDLSGGGMRFTTKELVENNSLHYVQLALPNVDLQSFVRVCLVEVIEDSKPKLYSVSVEYQDFSERERDQIIRFVFDKQRDMRQKGLI